MLDLPRKILVGFAVAFSLYFPLVGFLNVTDYRQRILGLIAVILYLIAVLTSSTLYKPLEIPRIQGLFNLLVAILVPILVNQRLSPADAQSFGAWYVGALGVLLAITAVRGHPLLAWVGLLSLGIQLSIWGSPAILLQVGFVGAALYVAAGQGIAQGLRSADSQFDTYMRAAQEAAATSARNTATRLERKRLVEAALQEAVPTLKYLVSRRGRLSEHDKKEAWILEAQLRDEIRGRDLVDNAIRLATKSARLRGVTVSLLDDGGLQGCTDKQLSDFRKQIVKALNSIESGQITVRAVRGEAWRVTILATRAGVTAPDLWLRL